MGDLPLGFRDGTHVMWNDEGATSQQHLKMSRVSGVQRVGKIRGVGRVKDRTRKNETSSIKRWEQAFVIYSEKSSDRRVS